MKISTVLSYLRAQGVTLSSKQEQILENTFGSSHKIDTIVSSLKELILKAIDFDANSYILHEDGLISKVLPKDEEVFFGIYINTLFSDKSFLILLPQSS